MKKFSEFLIEQSINDLIDSYFKKICVLREINTEESNKQIEVLEFKINSLIRKN